MYCSLTFLLRGRCSVDFIESTPNVEAFSSTPSQILLTGDLIIHASPGPSETCRIVAYSSNSSTRTTLTSRHFNFPTSVIALTLNHSPTSMIDSTDNHDNANLRVVAFYSNGAFSILSIPPACPSQSIETHHLAPTPGHGRPPGNPFFHAAYHHPLLVTVSEAYRLTIWRIPIIGDPPVPVRTLKSFTTFPPSSLSLSAARGGGYKLIITHCTPVFPAHYLPAVLEVTLSARLDIISSRTSNPLGVAMTWLDQEDMDLRIKEWSHKMSGVISCESDGKFVVMASANALQVC